MAACALHVIVLVANLTAFFISFFLLLRYRNRKFLRLEGVFLSVISLVVSLS